MTDYDPKPTAVHQQERYDDNDGGGALKWIIGLLVLAAIIAVAFIFFDVDKTEDGNFELPSVDVSGGDVDLPEFDVDAADIDVDLPSVRVEGGDIDVDLPEEGNERDDISDLDGEMMDGNIDVGADGNEPQGGDLPESIDED